MSSSSTPARSHAQTGPRKSQTTASTASKWGSFFQDAVAGLESRLDTILTEDSAGENSSSGADGKGAGAGVGSKTGSASVSRSGSMRTGEKGGRQGGFL